MESKCCRAEVLDNSLCIECVRDLLYYKPYWCVCGLCIVFIYCVHRLMGCHFFPRQIENLQEQLKDKEKQLSSLKERVKSLQADTSNTDTALTTLEEALAEKVSTPHTHTQHEGRIDVHFEGF